MARKQPPPPKPDPAATNNANEVQGDADRRSARQRQKSPPQFPENEGLVSEKTREDADALGGVEGEALEEARIASQRGRTA